MEIKQVLWPGWETTRLIGRGSFGAVYEIERRLFEDDEPEKAALKVISIPQNDSDIEELYNDGYDEESVTSTFHTHLKSIVAEYSLMRKMNGSSNIVNCDDVRYVQHEDGIGWDIYIKMELLTPLAKALPAIVSEDQVIRIAMDMCVALELCQKHNIIHRDIKPQNIFVSENGDYKLGDFGIAKTVEKTMGGTKTGTYKYMAPEVYSNRPYNSTADIYSLGLVLYWLLNERRMPFMPLPPEKLRAGMDEESRTRRFSGEKIPAPKNGSEELKRIVLKACAFDPKDRYQSAREMREDLLRLSGGYGPSLQSEPISDPEPDFDDAETVGPDFHRFSNNNQVDSDKTVGPIFKPKSAEDMNDLGQTGGPNFSSKKKQGKTKKKPWDEIQKKYRVLSIGLIVTILVAIIFLMFNCFGGSESVDSRLEADENIIGSGQEDRRAEVDELISKADRLASQYWYSEAIDLLDSFSVDAYQSPEIEERIAIYEEKRSNLIEFPDISSIPNISFNVLIADPDRAFSDEELGTRYAQNFVTVSEFEKILEQLYVNNYILVNLTEVVQLNAESGEVETQQLMLPAGKKPIMLTETLVNYFAYMIDSDGDGFADAGGDGFASRLVVRNGEIEAEYVDAFGNTQIGNFDFVPILEDFIKQHPDFAYHGARATLAVTGAEGVFGYRVNPSYIDTMGQEYVDGQIAQAKELVQVLQEKGYNIACNTYGNVDYQMHPSAQTASDIQLWNKEILPVLGQINTMVFARKSDLDDYSGPKISILLDNGFSYFIGEGSSQQNQQDPSYFHQNKITITGELLYYRPDLVSTYFDAGAVLSDQRIG